MDAILVNAIHCIAGGKHGLSAGFHVSRSVRVKNAAVMAVIGIERQITPRDNLLRRGKTHAQQMAAAGKTARIVVNAVIGGIGKSMPRSLM